MAARFGGLFFTKATPDLLLLLLLPLCCSGPARPVTTNANRVTRNVCSPEAALLKSRCVLKLVAARKAWLTRRKKVTASEKGNLRARWPCVFNWLLGKAEKVMCTNQSRITDQSESKFRPARPIRSLVFVPGSASPGLDRGSGQQPLFTKTKWCTGPSSRRREG